MNPEREDAVEREAEKIARAFHGTYERLAPAVGYETRKASAVEWDAVPQANRELMIATVDALLTAEVIHPKSTLLAARRRTEGAVEKAQARARASRESYRVTLCRAEKAESDRKWMLAALERLTDTRWPDRRNCPLDWDERVVAMVDTLTRVMSTGQVQRVEEAESERDALAGALREIASFTTQTGGTPHLVAIARAALAANPQASDG